MNSPIQNKINTIFVHVSDLPRSVKWYSELLGQDYDLDEVKKPVYNLKIDHHTGLTLDAGPIGVEKKNGASSHPLFNFHTEDISLAYNYVEKLGYKIEEEITAFDDFSFFIINDPDHNIIMICTG
ncbi:glyoxalase/bleomycin resistance/dioxygenase family protein [Virgibacillus indicus]|uniref:Glyoxalase/bleomycin resistance/dioxygenase family protein n=1 Tax=Virgibacillus indicus TaxID=2024554 RepID=A0A265N530_9BACI|nr:VOC family protein [Virgibacillus indicus]OZU87150.1 glyoxalase/bleomycin resistance/dioxygenase family protein [Virgibacillus indicus]